MPKGAVAALFAYNLINQSADQRDEIDFELISKYWNDSQPQINTNVFFDSSQGTAEQNTIPQVFNKPVDLSIIWSPNGITWLVDLQVVRTSIHAPQSDMSLTFNFWLQVRMAGFGPMMLPCNLQAHQGSNGTSKWNLLQCLTFPKGRRNRDAGSSRPRKAPAVLLVLLV